MQLHLVFVTHYRRRAITPEILERLRAMFWQMCRKMDCFLVENSGESDHVHLLIDFHPNNSISAVVGSLKASTARIIKKDFPQEYAKHYKGKSFWSGSYYVTSSGGAPIEKLKEYIPSQDCPTK